MHEANENMKKLSVSLFRANFKKEKKLHEKNKPINFDRKNTIGSSMTELIEVEEDEERETVSISPDSRNKKSIKLMEYKYTPSPSVGPTTS
jgi:hypothetical protein